MIRHAILDGFVQVGGCEGDEFVLIDRHLDAGQDRERVAAADDFAEAGQGRFEAGHGDFDFDVLHGSFLVVV